MRYSSNHKAETRQRIIGEAARRFRKDGIEGTGLVPLMKALGLTHGGFYAHFESKDALVQASLEAAAAQTLDRWELPSCAGKSDAAAAVTAELEHPAAGASALRELIDHYLSPQHRDDPGGACPLPTLAAELGLRGEPSPIADRMVTSMADRLAGAAVAVPAGEEGIVALAAMVGALTLARAVADDALSDRILAAVRATLAPQRED